MSCLQSRHCYDIDPDEYSADATYLALRCLFDCARQSSMDASPMWRLDATYTNPGDRVMTRYYHRSVPATIECDSSQYDEATGKYLRHTFTYTEGRPTKIRPPLPPRGNDT